MTKKISAILTQVDTRQKVLIFIAIFLIAGITPFFTHLQPITGPLVNALLLIATVLVGPFEAVMIGLVPSTVALASGTLPLPLAPMVPFIMIGNALFVGLFYYSKKLGFLPAVIIAALIKFVFLAGTVRLLMSTMIKSELVAKLSIMMSWPQLFTALTGGLIAYLLLKVLKHK